MLSSLFNFDESDILSVGVGIALALYAEPVWIWIRCKIDGKERKVKRPTVRQVLGAILALVLVWTIWSTNNTQKDMKGLSLQTLQIAEAACEEQKLATMERNAGQKLFFDGVFNVPAEIKALPQDDPQRRAWGEKLVGDYLNVFKFTNDERKRLAQDFREHPRTEPMCGKQ
jgi:hypothetical protein